MIFLCLALVWLTGFGLLRWLFPSPLRWSTENVLLFSLAAGVGIGITSCLYFVTLAVAGGKVVTLAAVEGVAAVAAIALGFSTRRRRSPLEPPSQPAPRPYLKALLLLALVMAATMFILYSLARPHGEADAWSIWNLHARFLSRGGAFWTEAFSKQVAWSHPDYPLLLPGIVALCWTLARTDSTAVPIAIAFLFTFAAAGVLMSTLALLRGKAQAYIAGILLLATASFVETGATQYADVPLSFYILATLALMCLQDRYPEDSRFTLLAGLTAGFAAWTKNEGLLFLAAFVLARLIALLRFSRQAGRMRQFMFLGAGALPPLIVVALFKLRYAPPNELTSRGWSTILHNLGDPSRWITCVVTFIQGGATLGGFLIPIVLVLALYWYLVRFQVEPADRPALTTALGTLALMLAGDFGVVFTPRGRSGDAHPQLPGARAAAIVAGRVADILCGGQRPSVSRHTQSCGTGKTRQAPPEGPPSSGWNPLNPWCG